MDKTRFELNPYLNSTKDRVIEAAAGDGRDASINARCCSEGLIILGVFVLGGRS